MRSLLLTAKADGRYVLSNVKIIPHTCANTIYSVHKMWIKIITETKNYARTIEKGMPKPTNFRGTRCVEDFGQREESNSNPQGPRDSLMQQRFTRYSRVATKHTSM